MRQLSDVLEAMIAVCEDEVTTRLLTQVLDSVNYTAPECMGPRWTTVQGILHYRIGQPQDAWQFRMRDIFVGVS